MFIEQIDKTRMLINLESEDLAVLKMTSSSISMKNQETRILLRQLLSLSAIKAGISLREKIISVEILPYDKGCFLLATIKEKSKRKMYKIKRGSSHLISVFNNAEDMFNAASQLYISGYGKYRCSIYKGEKGYFFLLESKAAFPKMLRIHLSEFGDTLHSDKIAVTRLRENCLSVCKDITVSELFP